MRHVFYSLMLMLVLASCAPKEPPLPPVPPMPVDLSPDTWGRPEWIEPPPPEPEPLPMPEPKAAANELLYHYEPNTEYAVPIAMGWPSNIVLEPGEEIRAIENGYREYLAEGEQPRWTIKDGISEDERTKTQHIFITASHPGLQQGVVVTTSRRTYLLAVRSVNKSHVRSIRWTYPPSPIKVVKQAAPTILPDTHTPHRFHVGYQISGAEPIPDWTPLWIGDDGRKTYLIFPSIMLYQEAPLLRLIGPQGPELVNFRQFHTVYIVDRLIRHLELRVGAGDHPLVLTVMRGELRTIRCPEHHECPEWPTAQHFPVPQVVQTEEVK